MRRRNPRLILLSTDDLVEREKPNRFEKWLLDVGCGAGCITFILTEAGLCVLATTKLGLDRTILESPFAVIMVILLSLVASGFCGGMAFSSFEWLANVRRRPYQDELAHRSFLKGKRDITPFLEEYAWENRQDDTEWMLVFEPWTQSSVIVELSGDGGGKLFVSSAKCRVIRDLEPSDHQRFLPVLEQCPKLLAPKCTESENGTLTVLNIQKDWRKVCRFLPSKKSTLLPTQRPNPHAPGPRLWALLQAFIDEAQDHGAKAG